MGKKKKENNDLLISLRKCSYILTISELTLDNWLKEKKYLIRIDKHGQQCIRYDDFKKLANDDKKKEKAKTDLKKYLMDRKSWNMEKMKSDIDAMLKKYREYVGILIDYHSELFQSNFILYEESPIIASLLLYSKVINMCNMFLDSVEESYSSAMLIIRTIDEANTLAQYFVVLKDDEGCKKDLIAWFRYEKSPQAAQCREKIAKALAPQAGIPAEFLENLYDELYETKSKSIHHSYRDCSELLEYDIVNEKVKVNNVSYKSANIYRQFELVDFFESIINNVMQGFLISFANILTEEKKNKLAKLTTVMSFK